MREHIDIVTRLLEGADRPKLIEIDEEFGSAEGYVVAAAAEQVPNWLERNSIKDDELVQWIQSNFLRVGFLNNINVEEEERGQQHGNEMLEDFLAEAENAGAEAIFLICDKFENQNEGFDLQRWYEKWGFRALRDTPEGPLMMLNLKNEQ